MKRSRSRRRRRAPIVLSGTVLGLAGVLSFRSVPATVSVAGLSSSATTSTTVSGASPPTTSTTTAGRHEDATATTTPAHRTTASTPTTVATTTPPTTVASATRSATGPVVNYYFGTISVKVTATGSKIDSISVASLNDGGNPRSQSIDQQSLPMLIQQAMAAQSAGIQGVSGATYTTQGFDTSLASALKSLGIA